MQHGQVVQPGGIVQYLIPIVVVAVVFAFRARRMTRSRPLKLGQLWIVPTIYLAMVAAAFATNPPNGAGWLAAAGGLAIGCGLGWYRGKTIAIEVDPVTRTLSQKASPLGILVLLALVVVKSAAQAGGRAAHLDVGVLTDGALALALGTFAVMRIEMLLRARRLLRAELAGRFG
ncbi:CcdC protein domain-containing protein [Sphingomonas bacterium]|uniref:CcdC protein domain-containing protein n=1 Tax=Sphingomonas bacterium TaxID=1895847 RepID=UPI00157609C4|nr:CcdC protein domain-containing protein [Sphingomonas bacterium]